MRGTRCLLAWYQTVSLCTSTPPTAQKTPTAPSRTRRERSTSAVKSTWPGVSIMLIWVSPQSMATAALLMVMPLRLLGGVEVGGGVALIDVADLVLGAAEEEDALRRGRFAGVHVGDDADVAEVLKHWYTAAAFAAAPETRPRNGSDPCVRPPADETFSPSGDPAAGACRGDGWGISPVRIPPAVGVRRWRAAGACPAETALGASRDGRSKAT